MLEVTNQVGFLFSSFKLCVLQTLDELHNNARLAHLDINLDSVVLHSSCKPWDSLRLLSLGLAQRCTPGDAWTTHALCCTSNCCHVSRTLVQCIPIRSLVCSAWGAPMSNRHCMCYCFTLRLKSGCQQRHCALQILLSRTFCLVCPIWKQLLQRWCTLNLYRPVKRPVQTALSAGLQLTCGQLG